MAVRSCLVLVSWGLSFSIDPSFELPNRALIILHFLPDRKQAVSSSSGGERREGGLSVEVCSCGMVFVSSSSSFSGCLDAFVELISRILTVLIFFLDGEKAFRRAIVEIPRGRGLGRSAWGWVGSRELKLLLSPSCLRRVYRSRADHVGLLS